MLGLFVPHSSSVKFKVVLGIFYVAGRKNIPQYSVWEVRELLSVLPLNQAFLSHKMLRCYLILLSAAILDGVGSDLLRRFD